MIREWLHVSPELQSYRIRKKYLFTLWTRIGMLVENKVLDGGRLIELVAFKISQVQLSPQNYKAKRLASGAARYCLGKFLSP